MINNSLLRLALIVLALLPLPLPSQSESLSLSIGDLLKKIVSPSEKLNFSNGFKTPEDAKQFFMALNFRNKEAFEKGEHRVVDSSVFNDLLSYQSNSVELGGWLPVGIYFSKTDNKILAVDTVKAFIQGSQKKVALLEFVDGKVIESAQTAESFINDLLLKNIKPNAFFEVKYNEKPTQIYVYSARDCSVCNTLSNDLHKQKVNHFVMPTYSMKDELAGSYLIRQNDIGVLCQGSQNWLAWMINRVPYKNLQICTEKAEGDIGKLEFDNIAEPKGFPYSIILSSDSTIPVIKLSGYSKKHIAKFTQTQSDVVAPVTNDDMNGLYKDIMMTVTALKVGEEVIEVKTKNSKLSIDAFTIGQNGYNLLLQSKKAKQDICFTGVNSFISNGKKKTFFEGVKENCNN